MSKYALMLMGLCFFFLVVMTLFSSDLPYLTEDFQDLIYILLILGLVYSVTVVVFN